MEKIFIIETHYEISKQPATDHKSQQQPQEIMLQMPIAHSVWMVGETEALIEWLEEPENLRKMKKGSEVTKKQIVKEIAAKISTKPEVKVGYKYDNLLKSYCEAAKLNNQSGWGLSMEDLDEGKKTLREKLLSRCPYFFRLEAIFGNCPNIRPLAQYDSDLCSSEATAAVERLLSIMGNTIGDEQDLQERNNNSEGEEGLRSWRRSTGGRDGEVDLIERDLRGERESEVPIGEEELVVVSETRRAESHGDRPREKYERLNQNTLEPSLVKQSSQASTSSAIKHKEKCKFPKSLEDDEEEDGGGGSGRNPRKKKGSGGALVDAVTILASAKMEGEEKNFDKKNWSWKEKN
ncbi:hypothetical protein L873DRAFT_1846983 [Choiromyces venosus 120613-1]|uniref:Uncharacterized protein n=1 Tax=Choiromyces venosus 120613-1 TaxID=1336337 RepID=A0A3N4J682_9PEZI|nr:hypothetical protein L873DRAFT_1846983 [Choiromyces venosus 120613-1]